MKTTYPISLFLVDDDTVFLKSLEINFLNQTDFIVKTFQTGEECISNLNDFPAIIILDYHLNGIHLNAMNGIETLDIIKEVNADIEVIILSSQDKIEVAVDCMHHKAFDYVVKSETAFIRLKKSIDNILESKAMQQRLKWYMDRL